MPIAKAAYVNTQQIWKIYRQRADLKWHAYEPAEKVKTLKEFIEIVDEDRYSCFRG